MNNKQLPGKKGISLPPAQFESIVSQADKISEAAAASNTDASFNVSARRVAAATLWSRCRRCSAVDSGAQWLR